MEVALVIVWIICGAMAAAIGVNRGLSGIGMFLAGLLLGPIGVLLAAVLQPSEEAKGQKLLWSGKGVRCPECREPIRADAKKCPHCQTTLSPADMEEAFAELTAAREKHQKANRLAIRISVVVLLIPVVILGLIIYIGMR